MMGRGYRVRGMSGWKVLRGERGGARLKPLIIGETIALLSQMWVRHRPQLAFQILCVKRIGKKRVS
jgi:hypothetical protein